ncbi:hypothetical protein C8Q78DRAFT_173432 [Trametes maxima]|nr:hypothetical protein C8Q78DRAFT_173432 [Trametes maxima]
MSYPGVCTPCSSDTHLIILFGLTPKSVRPSRWIWRLLGTIHTDRFERVVNIQYGGPTQLPTREAILARRVQASRRVRRVHSTRPRRFYRTHAYVGHRHASPAPSPSGALQHLERRRPKISTRPTQQVPTLHFTVSTLTDGHNPMPGRPLGPQALSSTGRGCARSTWVDPGEPARMYSPTGVSMTSVSGAAAARRGYYGRTSGSWPAGSGPLREPSESSMVPVSTASRRRCAPPPR